MAQKSWETYRLRAMTELLEKVVFKGVRVTGATVAWLKPLAEATADADMGLQEIRREMKKTSKAAKKKARKKAARKSRSMPSSFASKGRVNGHSLGTVPWPGSITSAPPWHPEAS